MKVILLQEVKKLGKKGEVLEVSEGYARNFLIPRKLAAEATSGKISELQHIKAKEVQRKDDEIKEAKKLADKISQAKFSITTKAGENGKLFGAVTSKEIAEQLQKEHGIKVDKRKIDLKEPIKILGHYTVAVKIHPEVSADLSFEVRT